MKIQSKIAKTLLVVIIAAVLTGCGSDSDLSYKVVKKSGYFIAGYDPDSYHTLDGYGLAVTIIKTAAERMGVEAPISPVNDYDWDAYLQNDEIDVMLCAETDTQLQTDAIFTDDIVLVATDAENIMTVGIIDSDACIEQKNVLSYSTSYDYVYYSDRDLLLNDLSLGIVDSAIMSEYDALSYSEISNYTVQVLSSSPVYFVVLSENQSFYEALNETLMLMSADGTIARLKSEYIQSID